MHQHLIIMAIAANKEQNNVTKDLIHPEWGNDVVRNKDGTVKNPMEMTNVYCVFFLFIVCWIGAEINWKFTNQTLYNDHLKWRPCYIIQLNANVFSNVSIFLTNAISLFLFSSRGYEDFCHLYSPMTAWCYSSFLFNILLSLIEACVLIVAPLWHEKHLRKCVVIFWVIELNLALALIINWQFIGGWSPLRCAIQVDHAEFVRMVIIFLFICCVIFCAIDSVLMWRLNKPRRSSTDATEAVIGSETKEPSLNNSPTPAAVAVIIDPTAGAGVESGTMGAVTENRSDLEAAKSFLIAIIPLFTLSLPFLLVVAVLPTDSTSWLMPYFIPVMMNVYSVLTPSLNVFLNEDYTSLPDESPENSFDHNPDALLPLY